MTKRWFYNLETNTTFHSEPALIAQQYPDAQEIPEKPDDFAIWDAESESWESPGDAYRYKRCREYPTLGDQLDALLKQFNYMQMTMGREDMTFQEKVLRSLNCIKELDAVIAAWLAIKAKYPKPTGDE